MLPSRIEGGSAAFGPDGKVLAALGSEGEVVVWDTATGTRIMAFRGFAPSTRVPIVGFSPDGRWLVGAIPWWVPAGSGQRVALASVVWDMATGHVARVFPGSVFFLPDGQLLVAEPVGALSSMTVWDGPLGTRLREVRLPWPEAVGGLSVSPDGQYIVFGLADGTIRFWELDAGHEVAELNLKAVLGVDPEVEFRIAEVSFSSDGELLLTAVWTPSVGRRLYRLSCG
ncbi:MAG: WD40 repeat domain-containing protein [Candidatus Bipolaricaulis sp.]|jgi:WD40 repeat protein